MENKHPPSPAQPHRKAKINRRQPLSPSPLQPRDPRRPPRSGPAFREPSEEVSAELGASSQAESTLRSGLCPAEDRKKEKGCSRTSFLPRPILAFWGRNLIPKQISQHRPEGACPPPLSFLGEPHPQLGVGGPARKDEGCRSSSGRFPSRCHPAPRPCLFCSGRVARVPLPRPEARSPHPWAGGTSWSLFHAPRREGVPPPYPGPQGSSRRPTPLCTVRSQNALRGPVPSPLSSQAGGAALLPRPPGGETDPGSPPRPQPACRCPRATPSAPAPAPHADGPAVAGRAESGAGGAPGAKPGAAACAR